MSYIGIGIVAVVVFYFVLKFIQSATPRGFAKQLAKAQLTSFYAFKSAYPNVPRDELYSQVISCRPGYDNDLAINIVSAARDVSKQMGTGLKFWMVVWQLASYEYLSRTGQSPLPKMNDLREGVLAVVPANL